MYTATLICFLFLCLMRRCLFYSAKSMVLRASICFHRNRYCWQCVLNCVYLLIQYLSKRSKSHIAMSFEVLTGFPALYLALAIAWITKKDAQRVLQQCSRDLKIRFYGPLDDSQGAYSNGFVGSKTGKIFLLFKNTFQGV